ncbi:MAG: OFA family MFS transporter, partial [Papillibacter sp.]|nr:OFA family MFS transporter [Papillibacter sp.]
VPDFYGPKNSGTNYGVVMLALGFSSIIFNAISSSFLKGNVTPTYIMAAITAIIPIFLMLVINKLLKAKKAQ